MPASESLCPVFDLYCWLRAIQTFTSQFYKYQQNLSFLPVLWCPFLKFFLLIPPSVSPTPPPSSHPLSLALSSLILLFLTFRNSIAASAVCAFNLSAISQVFNGPFKYQENSRSAWLPYPNPNPDFQVTLSLTLFNI